MQGCALQLEESIAALGERFGGGLRELGPGFLDSAEDVQASWMGWEVATVESLCLGCPQTYFLYSLTVPGTFFLRPRMGPDFK
jgi:hypothetical protein